MPSGIASEIGGEGAAEQDEFHLQLSGGVMQVTTEGSRARRISVL